MKTELVLKGGTRLASALWEGASSGAQRNCSLVACNLAVGKVRRIFQSDIVGVLVMVLFGWGVEGSGLGRD